MKFLIDANLPYRFSLWKEEGIVHVFDINPSMSDIAIWDFAKQNEMVIVTKDADFSDFVIISEPPPRVVHLKIGNMKISDFHEFLNKNWRTIRELAKTNKLVNVYKDKIVCVG